MTQGKIRVGFDFDGVLFYNPVRLLRAPLDVFKKKVLKVPSTTFFVAKSPLSRLVMRAVHYSSFMPNIGIREFEKLLSDPRFEVHIITARQAFLASDMCTLMRIYNVAIDRNIIHTNDTDEQAHLFKEHMLKKLKLQYYVEDNWDIVQHLRAHTDTKVIWIYNRIDKRFINDSLCAPDPRGAIELMQKAL